MSLECASNTIMASAALNLQNKAILTISGKASFIKKRLQDVLSTVRCLSTFGDNDYGKVRCGKEKSQRDG
jgi:hypothetical protein